MNVTVPYYLYYKQWQNPKPISFYETIQNTPQIYFHHFLKKKFQAETGARQQPSSRELACTGTILIDNQHRERPQSGLSFSFGLADQRVVVVVAPDVRIAEISRTRKKKRNIGRRDPFFRFLRRTRFVFSDGIREKSASIGDGKSRISGERMPADGNRTRGWWAIGRQTAEEKKSRE